jgi:hypothetical protein
MLSSATVLMNFILGLSISIIAFRWQNGSLLSFVTFFAGIASIGMIALNYAVIKTAKKSYDFSIPGHIVCSIIIPALVMIGFVLAVNNANA